MSAGLRVLVAATVTVLTGSYVSAHTPVDFLEVLKVNPARQIEHAVELKSGVDSERAETKLVGPMGFARSVGCMNRTAKKNPAYLNWYRIENPQESAGRQLMVLDMVRGSANKALTIGPAEFLLSPAQQITTGAPAPVPEGLDYYKAYRIIDAPTVDIDVELTSAEAAAARKLGKPLFVCIATRQWHHHEYVAATHPNDCFVVYALDTQERSVAVSTIDQFGLNELQGTQSQWLCVRAALLSSK